MITLLSTVAAVVDGDAYVVDATRKTAPVQANITGVQTLKLQGRLSPAFPWVDIATFTASDAQEVVLFPQMRGICSEFTDGEGSMTILADSYGTA